MKKKTQENPTMPRSVSPQTGTDPLEIKVSDTVYELAKEGKLKMILANLDPGADKAIQEGLKPKAVMLKARGTRKKGISFQVEFSDKVYKGYTVKTRKGAIIQQAIRKTARVMLGSVIASEAKQSHTSDIDEIPPE